jgi:beta-1,4-mannosyl-glycoprotein beta-1,4-N-acetylglucosaminyltransferase
MIYDCFSFFNELDLLEIRLNVLNDVVDKFVLVEATKTHSGKDKPLFFKEHKERFKAFQDKIIHIIVDEYPSFKTAWTFENHQRNNILRGLKDAKPEDVIMISDLDEIPCPQAVKIQAQNLNEIKLLIQKMHYYFLNYLNFTAPDWGLGTKMLPYRFFLESEKQLKFSYSEYLLPEVNQGVTPTKIRFVENVKMISNAGWHFSYLGGVDAIIDKIARVCHLEFTLDKYKDRKRLMEAMELGKDLYGRGDRFFGIEIDDSYPLYIKKNQEKYQHLVFAITPEYMHKTWLMRRYYFVKGWLFRFIVIRVIPRSLHPLLLKIRNLLWFGQLSVPKPKVEAPPSER